MITFSTDMLNAIRGLNPFCYLIKLGFDTPLYYTDNKTNVEYEGNTYISGKILSIGSSKQSSKPQVNQIEVEFDAVEQSLLSVIQNGAYVHRKIQIFRAYLNDDGSIVGALLHNSGRLESQSQKHNSSTSILKLQGSTNWANHEQISAIRCNVESQQRFYPNDYGYELAALITEDQPWGKKGTDDVPKDVPRYFDDSEIY
jgi:hypothetical protein